MSLPVEVLEHIVDLTALERGENRLRTLRNFCLTTKNLRPRAEMHIYSEIALYLGATSLCETTRYFVHTVERRPHLLLHVRQLDLKLLTRMWSRASGLDAIAEAMARMTNITKFTLSADTKNPLGKTLPRPMIKQSLVSSSAFLQAVSPVLKAPHLNYLVLHNLSKLPSELLMLPRCIHHLELARSTFEADGLPSKSRGARLPFRLSSFKCDYVSLVSLVNQFPLPIVPDSADGDMEHWTSMLSEVEVLDMTLLQEVVSHREVLRRTPRVRQLTLSIDVDDSTPQAHTLCFLADLHPASFTTLSLIDIHITIIVDRGAVIVYPYGSRWSTYLHRFTQLERLRIALDFEGDFEVHPESFGPQWGDIAEALADQRVCPMLKDVEIMVKAWTNEDGAALARRGQEGEAFKFIQSIHQFVYPSQFGALIGLHRQDKAVGFSFCAETSYDALIGSIGF